MPSHISLLFGWQKGNKNPVGKTIANVKPVKIQAALIVWCLTKFMITTNRDFDNNIILGKMHCSRNFVIIGVVLK